MKPVKLICLLGNPGKKYAATRHNIAWTLTEHLSQWDGSWKKKFQGSFCALKGVVLLKPETFMNHSGRSLQSALSFYKLKAEEVLVIHDELELDFGCVRWKMGGGTGGHNGLKSIKENLGTVDFPRLQLGIGRPQHGSPGNWVLQPFTEMEAAWIPELWKWVKSDLEGIIQGIDPKWGEKAPFME